MKHYTFVDYATQGYSALVGLLILLCHNRTVPGWPWLVAAHATGIVLVHLLLQAHGRGHPGKTLDFFRHFYPVLLYAGFFRETGSINRMFFAGYIDPVAIRWEQALFGAQPSVLFMDRLPYLLVSELFYAAYFCYYIMIVGVGLALFVRNRRQFFHYLSVLSFLFYVCYAIYDVVPIIGPRVFFRGIQGYTLPQECQQLAGTCVYPDPIKGGVFFRLMAWIYDVFEAPGAAFPSSHVAVALCTVYFSFLYLRRIRFLHLTVAVLLCFSTVYCRYHYVVDVLAGIGTAAVLVPIGNWLYFKFSTAERQESKPELRNPKATSSPPSP